MHRLSLLLVCACVLTAASRLNTMGKPFYLLEEAEKHFNAFIDKFNRSYTSETEKKARLEIFKTNLERINRKNMNPEEDAIFDITMFADLSVQEFIQQYTGLGTSLHVPGHRVNVSGPVTKDPPENFDWRDHNAVTPVKNQENCVASWAFSVTGTIEGAYARKHSSLIAVSAQQLVDCDYGNDGCRGGYTTDALHYLQNAGGIESEESYPYIADEESCKFDPKKIAVKITGQKKYDLFSLMDEEDLRQILISDGPMSIVVDGSSMQLYDGGILHYCNHINLNSQVLLVGYGKNKIPYWTIKNSWGSSWGEEGYIRVKRGKNPCGLFNRLAVTAIVD
ncbi:procathepsin L-like isoform X2 [Pectinophora gossypiella]|uniref:procathepsin L-like isoform X2 n=1 Tax=Pectinophora gossypiella TaxID=13191 RepID=UPI00214E2784|nr:procathepsin L-like isoform X2 [Pectinophora gossypiella]